MSTFELTQADSYDLIQRLKDINAVLRKGSGIVERYQGIAELALFRDWRKVGILTRALFDQNSQIRELVAHTLEKQYKLGETSNLIVVLLNNNNDLLHQSIMYREFDTMKVLLQKSFQLIKNSKEIDLFGDTVNTNGRHVCILLEQLSKTISGIQSELRYEGINPITELFETDTDLQGLKNQIFDLAMASKDIFCRRDAILLIGELRLTRSLEEDTFDFIATFIDRPENRQDYLVTRDGINACVKLSLSDEKYRERFIKLAKAFFHERSYEGGRERERFEYPYYTRLDCVEALRSIKAFGEIQSLLEDGKKYKYLRMGIVEEPRTASTLVKRRLIDSYLDWYLEEEKKLSLDLTETQKNILSQIREWIYSVNRSVREHARLFLTKLPNQTDAINYLLEIADQTDEEIEKLSLDLALNDNKALRDLLEDRQELSTVIATLLFSTNQDDQIVQRCLNKFLSWGSDRRFDSTGKDIKENSIRSRRESLWLLYEIGSILKSNGKFAAEFHDLSEDKVTGLQENETDISIRCVLELFKARASDDPFAYLRQVSESNVETPIRVAAEAELAMIRREGVALFSDKLLDYIYHEAINRSAFHEMFIKRILIVIASSETFPVGPETTRQFQAANQFLRKIIFDSKCSFDYKFLMRANLSKSHCYYMRSRLLRALLVDLHSRRIDSTNLRFGYMNLYQAGLHPNARRLNDIQLETGEEILDNIHAQLIQIKNQFQIIDAPIVHDDFRGVKTAKLTGLDRNTIVNVMHLSFSEPEIQSTKAYIQKQRFSDSFIFLDKNLSDHEIVNEILSSLKAKNREGKILDNGTRRIQVNRSIVGRIKSLTVDGCWVDVGIRNALVHVDRSSLIDENSDADNNEALFLSLEGATVRFNLRALLVSGDPDRVQFLGMELHRPQSRTDDELPVNTTIRAHVQSVAKSTRSVNFVWEGQSITVPIEDLSWNLSPHWIKEGWIEEFQRNKVYNLIFDGERWSLRSNPATMENYAKLLYEQGKDAFKAILIRSSEKGYEFEINPGFNCLIPPDMLQQYNDANQFEFVLPTKKMRPGDLLHLSFIETSIDEIKQIVLLLRELTEDVIKQEEFHSGTKIVGEIKEINEDKGTVLIKSDEPELADFQIIVNNIPSFEDVGTKFKEGDVVSGYISRVDRSRLLITLNYAFALPSDLELSKKYYVTVIGNTNSGLLVKYGNIVGVVEEKMLTFRHTGHILDKFLKGQKLYVRLDKDRHEDRNQGGRLGELQWEERSSSVLELKSSWDEYLARLGITSNHHERNTLQGLVISPYSMERARIDIGGGTLNLSLNDFSVIESRKNAFHPGNRVTLRLDKNNRIKLQIEQARINFRAVPYFDEMDEWKRFSDLRNSEEECYFVRRQVFSNRDTYYLFETADGEWIKINSTQIENIVERGDLSYWMRGSGLEDTPIYSGDCLVLKLIEEKIKIFKHVPGPLHLAYAGDNAELDPSNRPMIAAKVFHYTPDGGFLAELEHLVHNGEELTFRKGIVGKCNKQADVDLPRTGTTIKCVLNSPPKVSPKLIDYRLILNLHQIVQQPDKVSTKPSRPVPVQLSEEEIENRLLEFSNRAHLQPSATYKGRLLRYVEYSEDQNPRNSTENSLTHISPFGEDVDSSSYFEVALDELRGLPCEIYLPLDSVSYSSKIYNSIKSFEGDLPNEFSILNINLPQRRIELNLKINPPHNLQDATEILEWKNGTIVKRVVVVDRNMDKKSVTLELSPGFFVTIPEELVEIDFIPLERFDSDILGLGDLITIKIIKSDFAEKIIILNTQLAKIRQFANLRKVYQGYARHENNTVQLILDGIPTDLRSRCVLDVNTPYHDEELGKFDLFKCIGYDKKNITFKPISFSELSRGDIVSVTLLDKSSNSLRVGFGRSRTGVIFRQDISFRQELNLEDIEWERFEAVVARDVKDGGVVRFSLKYLAEKPSSFFTLPSVQEKYKGRLFSLIITRIRKDHVLVEIEPGMQVRLPFNFLGIAIRLPAGTDLRDKIREGDVITVRLITHSEQSYTIEIMGWVKSLLHFLKKNTLVKARFSELSGGKNWLFELTDYPERMGILRLSDGQNVYGIFSRDLIFSVGYIPEDPSKPIELEYHSIDDAQILARVDDVGSERISITLENGDKTFISSQDATYRFDNKSEYLQRTLRKDDVLLCQRRKVARSNSSIVTLKINELGQSRRLSKYLGQKLEFTFVSIEDDEIILEITPGNLVRIPLYSVTCHHQHFSVARLLPGDVLIANVFTKQVLPGTQNVSSNEEVYLDIEQTFLGSLHLIQGRHIVVAKVIGFVNQEAHKTDIGPRYGAAGILVKLGTMEQFLPEKCLLSSNVANDYPSGKIIWIKVDFVDKSAGYMKMEEIAPIKTLFGAETNLDDEMRFLLEANIQETKRNQLVLDVLGQSVNMWAQWILWNKNIDIDKITADDVLYPNESSLLVEAVVRKNGKLNVYPKALHGIGIVRDFKKFEIKTVPAHVEKINWERDKVKSVLLNIDGIRVLVNESDLVCGSSPDRVCVNVGTWMLVDLESVEYEIYDVKSQHLTVSKNRSNEELFSLPVGTEIQAKVAYTLDHGMVFRYGESLGYVDNFNIAWTNLNIEAKNIFSPGQNVTVYKAFQDSSRTVFDLRSPMQLNDVAVNDIIEVEILDAQKDIVCVKLQGAISALEKQSFSRRELADAGKGKFILVRVEWIDTDKSQITLIPHEESIYARSDIKTKLDVVRRSFEFHYSHYFNVFAQHADQFNFEKRLKDAAQESTNIDKDGISLFESRLTISDQFIQLLNNSGIPCVHQNIRKLLGWINKKGYSESLVTELSKYKTKGTDSQISYVITQLARDAVGKILDDIYPALNDLVHYAIGLSKLVSDSTVEHQKALSHLMRSHSNNPSVEVKIALLCTYEKLGLFRQRNEIAEELIKLISINTRQFLKVPSPISIDMRSHGIDFSERIEELNKKYVDLARANDAATTNYWLPETFERAFRTFEGLNNDLSKVGLASDWPEININLAICYALQDDLNSASRHIKMARDILRQRHGFAVARDVLLRLELYLQLRIGQYHQFHHSLETAIPKAAGGSQDNLIQSLVGYIAFCSQNYQLSRQIVTNYPITNNSILIYQLLAIYWDLQDNPDKKSVSINNLTSHFTNSDTDFIVDNQAGLSKVKFIPAIPENAEISYIEFVQMAQEYDAIDYALEVFNLDTRFKNWVGDGRVANGMINIALKAGKARMAKSILESYLRFKSKKEKLQQNEACKDAIEWCLSYGFWEELAHINKDFPDLELKSILESTYSISVSDITPDTTVINKIRPTRLNSLIEYWAEHDVSVGTRILDLCNSDQVLSRFVWNSREMREKIFDAMDRRMDYASVRFSDKLVGQFDIDAIQDIGLHWFISGLQESALEFLDYIVKTKQMSSSEKVFVENLSTILKNKNASRIAELVLQFSRSELVATDWIKKNPEYTISALEFLTKHPDEKQRAKYLLIKARVLEIQNQGLDAAEIYRSFVSAYISEDMICNLRAHFGLIRVSVLLNNSESMSNILPSGLDNLVIQGAKIGALVQGISTLAPKMTNSPAKIQFILGIDFLEYVLNHYAQFGEINLPYLKACIKLLTFEEASSVLEKIYDFWMNSLLVKEGTFSKIKAITEIFAWSATSLEDRTMFLRIRNSIQLISIKLKESNAELGFGLDDIKQLDSTVEILARSIEQDLTSYEKEDFEQLARVLYNLIVQVGSDTWTEKYIEKFGILARLKTKLGNYGTMFAAEALLNVDTELLIEYIQDNPEIDASFKKRLVKMYCLHCSLIGRNELVDAFLNIMEPVDKNDTARIIAYWNKTQDRDKDKTWSSQISSALMKDFKMAKLNKDVFMFLDKTIDGDPILLPPSLIKEYFDIAFDLDIDPKTLLQRIQQTPSTIMFGGDKLIDYICRSKKYPQIIDLTEALRNKVVSDNISIINDMYIRQLSAVVSRER